MKKLFYTYTLIVIVIATVCACSPIQRENSTLLAADSLMSPSVNNAAGALKLLLEIDSLSEDRDKALYALLYTKARFKTSNDVLDTVAISNAVQWYADHGPKNRLVESLCYAGAAAETMNDPIAAIRYYKSAEFVADTADHYNLGYIHMRMAELYCANYCYHDQAKAEYARAIYHFTESQTHKYVVSNLYAIASEYCHDSLDTAMYYLNESKEYAIRHGLYDKYKYSIMSETAKIQSILGDSTEGARLSVLLVANDSVREHKRDFYYFAAISLAKMGNITEAMNYLSVVSEPITTRDSSLYFIAKRYMARAQHDYEAEHLYKLKSQVVEDSTLVTRHELRIDTIANYLMFKEAEKRWKSNVYNNYFWSCVMLLSLILLICYIIYYQRSASKKMSRDYESLKAEFKARLSSLETNRQSVQHEISQLQISQRQDALLINRYQRTLSLIETQESITKQIYDTMWTTSGSNKDNVVNISLATSPEINSALWKRLVTFACEKYGSNFETFLNDNYKYELSTSTDSSLSMELRFILLLVIDLPDAIICSYCNLSNVRSVSNKKYKLGMKCFGKRVSILDCF